MKSLQPGRAQPLVLVVDDDPSVRLLVAEALQPEGCTIEEADDGLSALAAFEQRRPDVVLLDVKMAQMDGFAVCTAMRKSAWGSGMPIVMITGLDDVGSINRAYEVGATDFITKPINWSVLAHRVRYVLRASHAFDDLRRSKDSLIKAQRIARVGNWDWDIRDGHFRWSGEIYDTLGMSWVASAATCEAFLRLVHPEDRECIRAAFEAAVAGERPLDVEHRVVAKDGQVRFMHQRGEASFDPAGGATHLTGTTQDISERVLAEEKLRLAANALEHSAEAVMISDASGRIVSVNKAFTTMTGYAPDQAIGRSPEFLRAETHDPAFYSEIWDTANRAGHWQGELCAKRSSGEIYPQWISISQVKDKAGRSSHYVSVSSDISKYKQYEARLDFLAHHDALTDLPNRLSFQTHLQEVLSRARRDGNVLALMFIDLDQFKLINDSLGHAAGDCLLAAAGQRLAGCLRQTDLIARLGGDEFVVAIDGIAASQDLARIADKLIDALARPFAIAGKELFISGSIGISCYPRDGTDADILLKNADAAMYRAKELGGNICQFFSADMNAGAIKQMLMTNGLRLALAQSEFVLHYQPRIELRSGRITGVEALIRWQHPERGLIAPAQFIPLAEETGLIGAIGEWVLRTACKHVRAWQERGLPPLRVAVNLSARQIRHRSFMQQLASILSETGLEPGLLELEITESTLMQDPEKTGAILADLKSLGVAIAIDDFGTGYSSLAYLRRLPVDYLKIDRSFVRDLADNPDDGAIVKAIIALAKSLKLRVIAEGMENRDQRSFLAAHGCDEGQGYLITRPLAASDMEEFLRARLLPQRNPGVDRTPTLVGTGAPALPKRASH